MCIRDRTVFDESCLAQQTILVSGGRIGTQIECAPQDLVKVTRGKTAAIDVYKRQG